MAGMTAILPEDQTADCPNCGQPVTGYADHNLVRPGLTGGTAVPEPRATTLLPCGCSFWSPDGGPALTETHLPNGTVRFVSRGGPVQPVISST